MQPTYKEALTISAACMCQLKSDIINITSNTLSIVTAAGLINGQLITEEIRDSLKDDPEYIVFQRIHSNATLECNADSSHAILLKNAKLLSNSGAKVFFKYLFVFPEDIIALSIADISGQN